MLERGCGVIFEGGHTSRSEGRYHASHCTVSLSLAALADSS